MESLLVYLEKKYNEIQEFKIGVNESYDDFLHLIAFDFVEKILKNSKTNKWYLYVYNYFSHLLKSEEFQKVQNDIFDCIEKIGKYLNKPNIIKGAQDDYNKNYSYKNYNYIEGNEKYHNNPLLKVYKNKKIPSVLDKNMPNSLDLIEFSKICFQPANYLLFSKCPSSYSPTEEISDCHPISPQRRQYEITGFVINSLYRQYEKMNSENNKLILLIQEYNDLKIELRKMLVLEPKKIHYKSYEEIYRIYERMNFKNKAHKVFPRYLMDDSEKYINECKVCIKVVYDDLLLYFGDTKENTASDRSFKKLQTEKGDLEFGDGYFISPNGHIFKSDTGELIEKAQSAGYYLLKNLKSSGGGKSLGSKDFKPKKPVKFAWSTITKVKLLIIKACGKVIDTNANGEYWYCYRED